MNKPTNKIKLTAYGAAMEVGRSAFIIEDDEYTILLDAGIKIQPKRAPSLAPEGLKERAQEIDAILLSHAHIDHSGYIPAMYEHGYKGKIYMTNPTRDIVSLLWTDQLKIDGRHWSLDSMEIALLNVETMKYRQNVTLGDDITITMYNSGHILGAAMIFINWKGVKILYTGDINDQTTPLFNGFDIPSGEIDILLAESTNGVRIVKSREEVSESFVNKVQDVLNSGNKAIIPSFAIGRSQELLCVLTEKIKDYPIYVDGMINKMIEITEQYLNEDWVDVPILERMKNEGIISPFKYSNVIQITPQNMDNTHNFRRHLGQSSLPYVILTTSGMMEPSPLHTHLRYAANEKNNLIAVTGYQAEGTTGREILEGSRTVKLSVSRDKLIDVQIKAKVLRFGFSGHTSSKGIDHLIKTLKPKQIFLIHGDNVNQKLMVDELGNGVIPKPLAHSVTEIISN